MDTIKYPNLIILGPQGSGKTTQAKIIEKKFGYTMISMGNLVRNRIKIDDYISRKINSYISKGELVPERILFEQILKPELENINKNKPILFEGVPRNQAQIKLFDKIIKNAKIDYPYLIFIDIDQQEIFKRISARLICSKCSKNFKPGDSGYKEKKCPKDGTILSIREDDQDEKALSKRLEIFETHTKKVIDYFRSSEKLVHINGDKSIPEVSKEIEKGIKSIL